MYMGKIYMNSRILAEYIYINIRIHIYIYVYSNYEMGQSPIHSRISDSTCILAEYI